MPRRSQGDLEKTVDALVDSISKKIRTRELGFRQGEYVNYSDLDRIEGGPWTWSDKRKAMDILGKNALVESDPPKGFKILKRQPRIGLVVSNANRPFVQPLQIAISQADAIIDFVNTHEDPDQEFQALQTLFGQVDGVLLNPVMISNAKRAEWHVKRVQELVGTCKARLVLIDRPYFQAERLFCLVQTDNIAGGRIAARYLFDKYKQQWRGITPEQIASHLFVAFHYWTTPELERSWGFEEIIHEKVGFDGWPSDRRIMGHRAGDKHRPVEVIGTATANELLRRINLALKKRPDMTKVPFTCFCVNDELATAVVAKLLDEDVWVKQLSAREFQKKSSAGKRPIVVVQGFDGLHVSKTFGFASVRQPFEEIGRRAAQLLVKHIHAGTVPEPESCVAISPGRLQL